MYPVRVGLSNSGGKADRSTRIIYNGIDLGVLETYAFDCEAVYDQSGVDYLYTRISIIVRAMVNGQVEVVEANQPANGPFMSYSFTRRPRVVPDPPQLGRVGDPVVQTAMPPLPGGPNPGAGTNTTPPNAGVFDRGAKTARVPLRSVRRVANAPILTHQTIRHRLLTPRAQLYVFAGAGQEIGRPLPGTPNPPVNLDLTILTSPGGNLPTDCKNGPTPKVFNIQEALGDANTFVVDWACETFIQEASLNNVYGGALLSNRFAQTHAVDDDGYTTIATQGVAIFRTDFIYGMGAGVNPVPTMNPDTQRPILFMPIPRGFVRGNIQVTGREDVTGVDYAYEDRQVRVNFVAGQFVRAAKVSAVHRQAMSGGNITGGLLKSYERVLGLAANRNFARREGPTAEERAADAKRAARMDKLVRRLLKKEAK